MEDNAQEKMYAHHEVEIGKEGGENDGALLLDGGDLRAVQHASVEHHDIQNASQFENVKVLNVSGKASPDTKTTPK